MLIVVLGVVPPNLYSASRNGDERSRLFDIGEFSSVPAGVASSVFSPKLFVAVVAWERVVVSVSLTSAMDLSMLLPDIDDTPTWNLSTRSST